MTDIATLVVPTERRARPGERATHALIIGVSQYRHLAGGPSENAVGLEWQMAQLSCAAGSASEVAAWLATRYQQPAAPIGSLRVLLSPSPADTLHPMIAPHIVGSTHLPTRTNVETAFAEFAGACSSNPDNVAIVYVAGHGIQLTKHDAIVLLEDVALPGKPSLYGAIDMIDCHRGLNHPSTAQTQFWFVDACRQPPEIAAKFATMKGAFQIDELPGTAASSQCYLSTSTLQESFGIPGGRTLFCDALLRCLDQDAISPPTPPFESWHVSSTSLTRALTRIVRALAAEHGEVQTVHQFMSGQSATALLHQLEKPPLVDLTVHLSPAEAAAVTTASVYLETGAPVPDLPAEWPLMVQLEAGLYSLQVTTEQPYRPFNRPINLKPPGEEVNATVTP